MKTNFNNFFFQVDLEVTSRAKSKYLRPHSSWGCRVAPPPPPHPPTCPLKLHPPHHQIHACGPRTREYLGVARHPQICSSSFILYSQTVTGRLYVAILSFKKSPNLAKIFPSILRAKFATFFGRFINCDIKSFHRWPYLKIILVF